MERDRKRKDARCRTAGEYSTVGLPDRNVLLPNADVLELLRIEMERVEVQRVELHLVVGVLFGRLHVVYGAGNAG